MPAPPARTAISDTYPNPSNAVARTGFGALWDYVTGLLGATGNAAEARVALGLGQASSLGFRNRLINPTMRFNQRAVAGTVVLASGAYGHDRWKGGASGCTYTFSTSGLDTTLTISAGSLIQVVEGLHVEGGDYALSWTGTAQGKIGAGSYGASGISASSVTSNTNLSIEFNTGTLSKAQLEPGLVATTFERRAVPLELVLCQRYYETGLSRIGGYAGAGGVAFFYNHPFKATKRGVPTLGYGSTTTTNVSTFDARNPSDDGLLWYCTSTAAGGFQWDGTWSASSEL